MSSLENVQVLGMDEAYEVEIEAAVSAANAFKFAIPYHCQVEDFGVVITENFVTQVTTEPVAALGKITAANGFSGTVVDLVTLTLGNGNTSLKQGDGTKAAQTAIALDTDLDDGDVVYADLDAQPVQFAPGDTLVLYHKTAGSDAGGSYIPFVRLRVGGAGYEKANAWTHVD